MILTCLQGYRTRFHSSRKCTVAIDTENLFMGDAQQVIACPITLYFKYPYFPCAYTILHNVQCCILITQILSITLVVIIITSL